MEATDLSLFEDPKDKSLVEDILLKISSFKGNALVGYIRELSPDWIVAECPNYSPELVNFITNWGKVCQMCNVEKAGIILVKEVIFEDPENRFRILRQAGEELTKNGYSVRRSTELVGCKRCNKAILSKLLSEKYHKMFTGYCGACVNTI